MSNNPTDGFSEERRERPLDPMAPPRKPYIEDDYDYRPPRQRSNEGSGALKIILIVVGAVIALTLLCGGGLVALLFYSVAKVRTASSRAQSSNNMKQIGLAMQNYHDVNGHLVSSIRTKDGKPGLSWRVAILPYIEQEYLYRQFKLDEPWDSPNNRRLLSQMPRIYMNPRMAHPMDQTCYRVFVGGGAMFEHGKKSKLFGVGKPPFDEIYVEDGTANTIMVVESSETVPWTKPDELVFQPNGPVPSFGPLGEKHFMVLMADGSVRSIPSDTDPISIRAAITAAGGEPVLLP